MLRAAWRNLWQHKLRLVLSMLAIVLSVGFVVGTLIFGATLNRSFTDLFAQTTSDVVVGCGDATSRAVVQPAMSRRCRPRCWPRFRELPGAAAAGGAVFADGVGHHRR